MRRDDPRLQEVSNLLRIYEAMSANCPKCHKPGLLWMHKVHAPYYACPNSECGWCFTEKYFHENRLPLPDKVKGERKPQLQP